jgi:hypothetical protein
MFDLLFLIYFASAVGALVTMTDKHDVKVGYGKWPTSLKFIILFYTITPVVNTYITWANLTDKQVKLIG